MVTEFEQNAGFFLALKTAAAHQPAEMRQTSR
jgi:hypothetical protein